MSTVGGGKVSSSAEAPQAHLLEDMRGFELKIHSLVYIDKTSTVPDLWFRVRRDIILDILSQVGRNFNNIGLFLREKLDLSRWAPGFDLKQLMYSGSVSSSATTLAAPPSLSSFPSSSFSLPSPMGIVNMAPAPPVIRDVFEFRELPATEQPMSTPHIASASTTKKKTKKFSLFRHSDRAGESETRAPMSPR